MPRKLFIPVLSAIALSLLPLCEAAWARSAEEAVTVARSAANAEDHDRAIGLFEEAMTLAPSRRQEWLREYADQLAYAGRPGDAVPLYREYLSHRNVAGEERLRTRISLAYALLWSGDTEAAVDAWQSLAAERPADTAMRANLADAQIAAARAAADRGENAAAADFFEQAIRTDPAQRSAVLREYADQLLYSGQPGRAEPLFRELTATDEPAAAERRAVRLGLARSLAWDGRHAAALPEYDRLLAEWPGDAEGLVGRGQSLNELRRHDEAFDAFNTVLAHEPQNEEALRGAAQAETSMGRHRSALARLSPLMGAEDPRTLIIAAQAQRFSGRPDLSERLVGTMLSRDPDDPYAPFLLRELTLERRPFGMFGVRRINRSDDLQIEWAGAEAVATLNHGLTKIGAKVEETRFRGATFPSVDILGLGASLRHQFDAQFDAGTSVTFNQEREPGREHWTITHDTHVGFSPDDTWRAELVWDRRYVDENPRSIVNDVMATDVGVNIRFTPGWNTRAALRTLYGNYTDGNERLWGQFEAEHRIVRAPDIWVGARYTAFDFAEELNNGYWNPSKFQALDATLHAYDRLGESWRYDVQAAAGPARAEPGSGGYGFYGRAALTYEAGRIAAFDFYAIYQTSTARTGDLVTSTADERFSRSVVGGQFRIWW